jgi:colanic acid/amylovoran biosynthesis glycosyltransferase
MRLLLLTQTYPFGPGEAFLGPELERLSRSFEVVVVPARRITGSPRDLPSGIGLDTSLARRPILAPAAPMRFMRPLGAALAGELRERWRDVAFSPRRMAFLSYYLLRGARAAHWLMGDRNAARRADETLVYCYWSNAEAFGAALATKRSPLRFACRAHGGDLYERPDVFGYLPFRGFIMSRASLVMTVSDHGRAHLARRHPDSASKVVTARIPIDIPSRWVDCPSDDPIVIASCSSDTAIKRLSLIAGSVSCLASQHPDRRFKWMHVGVATSRIREIVAPHRPSSNLEVEGFDWMPPLEVRETLLRARPSVFVNLSSTEGLPATVIEALGLGIPVVGTSAGGTGEFVDDAVGRLLPIEVTPQRAAEALARVIDTRDRLRSEARSRILDRCDATRAGESICRAMLDAAHDRTEHRP